MGFKEHVKKGTYAGVRLSDDDSDFIIDWVKELKLPNPTPKKDLHLTLLYSKKYLPDYKPAGKIDEWAYPLKFHVFETFDNKRALVLKVKSPFLLKRHKELMKEHDATYDYPEYIPHITLSYDIGDMEVPKFDCKRRELHLGEEYAEELKLDWKPKKS